MCVCTDYAYIQDRSTALPQLSGNDFSLEVQITFWLCYLSEHACSLFVHG